MAKAVSAAMAFVLEQPAVSMTKDQDGWTIRCGSHVVRAAGDEAFDRMAAKLRRPARRGGER